MNKRAASLPMMLLGVILAFAILFFVLYMINKGVWTPASGLIESAPQQIDKITLQAFSFDVGSDGTLTLSSGVTSTMIRAASTNPLSGSMAEKGVQAAKEAGLSRTDAETVLKLMTQESGFKHCCATAGKNNAGTCTATADESCGLDRILTSGGPLAGAGTSKGIMQLNDGAHPVWFTDKETELCAKPENKADCLIKQNAGCMGKTAFQVDCNIRLGVRYLMWAKAAYGKGRHYTCKTPDREGLPGCNLDVTYYAWDAALRTYNGWGCPKDNVQCRYVDHVNTRDISAYKGILDAAYT